MIRKVIDTRTEPDPCVFSTINMMRRISLHSVSAATCLAFRQWILPRYYSFIHFFMRVSESWSPDRSIVRRPRRFFHLPTSSSSSVSWHPVRCLSDFIVSPLKPVAICAEIPPAISSKYYSFKHNFHQRSPRKCHYAVKFLSDVALKWHYNETG